VARRETHSRCKPHRGVGAATQSKARIAQLQPAGLTVLHSSPLYSPRSVPPGLGRHPGHKRKDVELTHLHIHESLARSQATSTLRRSKHVPPQVFRANLITGFPLVIPPHLSNQTSVQTPTETRSRREPENPGRMAPAGVVIRAAASCGPDPAGPDVTAVWASYRSSQWSSVAGPGVEVLRLGQKPICGRCEVLGCPGRSAHVARHGKRQSPPAVTQAIKPWIRPLRR